MPLIEGFILLAAIAAISTSLHVVMRLRAARKFRNAKIEARVYQAVIEYRGRRLAMLMARARHRRRRLATAQLLARLLLQSDQSNPPQRKAA